MLQFTVSKTYEIVTEESAELGDAEERGFVYEDDILDFRGVIRELERCYEISSSTVTTGHEWAFTEPETDYRTGEERSESIHISQVNGKPITAHQLQRLFKAAGLLK